MEKISEKLFLLSLYEKRNNSIHLSKSPLLSYGLLAGSLLDLVFSGIAEVNSSKKFAILNPITTERFIPKDLLKQILFEKDTKKTSFWIEAIGRKRKRIESDFVQHFVKNKILIIDKQIFHFQNDFANRPNLKFIIKEKLRGMVLGGKEFDTPSFLLLKLLEHVYLLDQIFTFDEIKSVRPLIDALYPASENLSSEFPNLEQGQAIIDSLEQVVLNQKGRN